MPKKIPHTLESLREKDETMLVNAEAEEQEEVNSMLNYCLHYFIFPN